MKKLFLLPLSILSVFVLVYSCSEEEEEMSSPPSVVQSQETIPDTTQYTLTVSAGEGGVVSTEGGTYDEGTEITITATPDDGYEFLGWEGSDSDSNTLTLALNSDINIQALFQRNKSSLLIRKNTFNLPMNEIGLSAEELDQTLQIVSGPFHYASSNKNYMLFPGQAWWIAGRSDIGVQERTDENRVPSFTLIKENGLWKYNNSYQMPGFWGPRNFEKRNDVFFICDGNEIGDLSQGDRWEGDLFMGQVISDGNIIWTRVNNDSEMGYYHGLGVGDLNADGLLDVGVAPGKDNFIQLFYQNGNGSFKMDNTKIRVNSRNEGQTFDITPFTMQISDLNGDDYAEIITASYGGGDPNNDKNLNDIRIYQLNQEKSTYKLEFVSRIPSSIYNIGLGATSIKVLDINNDNNKDLIVAREGFSSGTVNSFEAWIAKSNFEYELSYTSPIYSQQDLLFREFLMFDVNNDNYDDIVLRPHAFGSLYRIVPNNFNILESGGVKLNHLIWLNNQDGTFSNYTSKELIAEDLITYNLFPYMENNKLHFMGIYSNNAEIGEVNATDIEVNLD